MEKIIMHSDLNCFYASVEMLRNPRLRHIPMAVCVAQAKNATALYLRQTTPQRNWALKRP